MRSWQPCYTRLWVLPSLLKINESSTKRILFTAKRRSSRRFSHLILLGLTQSPKNQPQISPSCANFQKISDNLYWSGISLTFFEPRSHEDTEKNTGKTPCLCVFVVKGFVRPLSDDYKISDNSCNSRLKIFRFFAVKKVLQEVINKLCNRRYNHALE